MENDVEGGGGESPTEISIVIRALLGRRLTSVSRRMRMKEWESVSPVDERTLYLGAKFRVIKQPNKAKYGSHNLI